LTFLAQSIVRTAPGVIVKSWDEDLALAYALSQGKTHLISAAGAAILEAAAAADVSALSLLALYVPDMQVLDSQSAVSPDAESHLRLTLEGLSGAGLLRVWA
jgi:hypothetical protein